MGDFGDFKEYSSASLPVKSNFKTFFDNSRAVESLALLAFFLDTLTSISRWLTALLAAAIESEAEDIFLLWVFAVAVDKVDNEVEAADVEADVADVLEVGDKMDVVVVVLPDLERCSIATMVKSNEKLLRLFDCSISESFFFLLVRLFKRKL